MEFQRGGDIKEALRIGKEANSYGVYAIAISCSFTEREPSGRIRRVPFHYDFVENQLIRMLEMLERRGLDKDFHEYLSMKTFHAFISKGNNPENFDGDPDFRAIALVFDVGESLYRDSQPLPWFFGKFAKYRGVYYEIKDDPKNPGYWNE